MRENDKHFYKNLFVLVLPIAFQNLMSALVSASDAMMLGMVNQDSLSAVSLAAQVQFVLSLFWAALTIGTTILAAQYWGKNDRLSVEKILAIVLKYSFVISFLFFAAAALCPRVLMHIFTNDETLITLGAEYLRIVSWSYLLAGISQIYLCIMRNSGRTLKSTVFGSVSMVLNIFLNGILIFGLLGFPKLGISGGGRGNRDGQSSRADSGNVGKPQRRCGPDSLEPSEKITRRTEERFCEIHDTCYGK